MNYKLNVPKISKTEFSKRLGKRRLEDLKSISVIERRLKQKRGWVFKMPKPGSKVILMISGGIDSVVCWELLMKKYSLKVHPIFLKRVSKSKMEAVATKFFARFFKQKFPTLFVPPTYLSAHLPAPEISKTWNDRSFLHPEKILDWLDSTSKGSEFQLLGISPFLIPFYGVMYSKFFEYKTNTKIRTIFVGVGGDDGIGIPNQTFTAMRSTLLSMCLATGDFSWNFGSPIFEKELGSWLTKREVISLGERLQLPLEKTWSCYQRGLYQCGEGCLGCRSRKYNFDKAGVLDKTVYRRVSLISKFWGNLGVLSNWLRVSE